MEYITIERLKKICSEHKYIGLREADGLMVGHNCGVAKIARQRNKKKKYSRFIGFKPLSLNEYINIKIPFDEECALVRISKYGLRKFKTNNHEKH